MLVFHDVVPMWPAIVVTAVIVVGLVALRGVQGAGRQEAAAAIEKGLRDQAARQSEGDAPRPGGRDRGDGGGVPARRVAALKSVEAGRSGRDALGVLPWYVMIGPSASGKTHRHPQLGPEDAPAGKAGKVRGVGGTRNCDWWMTNEAILLDTAGRWSTDDDDREEWLAFLDLLKKTRPEEADQRHPAGDQRDGSAGRPRSRSASWRRTLRERIDEVIARLEMVVPVYLIFTKCDLISGFVETFGDLEGPRARADLGLHACR